MQSFDDLLAESDRFFCVPTTNGFKLSHSLPVCGQYRLQSGVFLPPLELQPVADKFEPSPKLWRSVNFTFSAPPRLDDVSLTVGRDLAASISLRLTSSLSAFANVERSSGAAADFGVGVSASAGLATLAVEFRRSFLRYALSFSLDDIGIGFARCGPSSTSVVLRVPVGRWRAQLVAEMRRQEATLSAWNGTTGAWVRLQPGQWPVAGTSWRLNINECAIHSSADTEGNVRSRMQIRLNSKCTMAVSMALVHREARYRVGLTLDFRE
jgi:hypothetical protein